MPDISYFFRAKDYTRSQQLKEASRMTESNMNVEIDTRSRRVFGQSPLLPHHILSPQVLLSRVKFAVNIKLLLEVYAQE
jgi:hypothetical protein